MMSSTMTSRQWMITAIILMAIGIVLGIAGCVVAAVGFGLHPKDMFDYPNLAMRISGLVLVGFAVLPLAISVCCWMFFCAAKREGKQAPGSSQAYVVNRPEAVAMTQYPYSTSEQTDTRIYKPQQQPVSGAESAGRYANMYADDSSAPLTFSSSTSPRDVSGAAPGSSFDYDDPSVSKGRRPKKGKKGRQTAGTGVGEEESMMSGGRSTLTSSSFQTDVKA